MAAADTSPGTMYHCIVQGSFPQNPRYGTTREARRTIGLIQEDVSTDMCEWERAPRPADLPPSEHWSPDALDFVCMDNHPYATMCIGCKQHNSCQPSCSRDRWVSEKAARVVLNPTKYVNEFPGPTDQPVLALKNIPLGAIVYAVNRIGADKTLGFITGQIRPRSSIKNEQSPDVRRWPFGYFGNEKAFGRIAVLDSTRYGNALKFLRYSCNPDCAVIHARVGFYSGLFIRRIKDVSAGEPLTFRDDSNPSGLQMRLSSCMVTLAGEGTLEMCVCREIAVAYAMAEKLASWLTRLAKAKERKMAAQAAGDKLETDRAQHRVQYYARQIREAHGATARDTAARDTAGQDTAAEDFAASEYAGYEYATQAAEDFAASEYAAQENAARDSLFQEYAIQKYAAQAHAAQEYAAQDCAARDSPSQDLAAQEYVAQEYASQGYAAQGMAAQGAAAQSALHFGWDYFTEG